MKAHTITPVLTAALLLVTGYAAAQGSLTPPGPPAPTMKTLQQVEPRTLISSVPYAITNSGSYYLSQNLTATPGNSGITVNANDVAIDLNGFTLDGAGTGYDGINQGAAYHRLTIRNGKVNGWSAKSRSGIRLLGGEAVLEDLQLSGNLTAVSSAGYATLRRCEAVGNNSDGFNLNQGMVLDCRAADNFGDGIEIASNGVVRASVCANNGKININVSGSGCTIENNRLTGGATGIALQSGGNRIANNEVYGARDNYDLAQGNQLDLLLCEIPESIDWSASVKLAGSLESTGHGVVITASGVTLDLMGFTLSGDRGSSDYGLFLDGETNSAIRNVVVRNGIVRNFDDGVRAEYTQDSRFEHLITATNRTYGVYLNGTSCQCNGNTIADCTISGNGSSGVYLYSYSSLDQCNGNTIADCTISGNGSDGIRLLSHSSLSQCAGNTITGCTISENVDYGVYLGAGWGECAGNTITGCTISKNADYGVYLSGYPGWCGGNKVADCTIRRNAERGIFIHGAYQNRVEGNHITGQIGATTYGIYCNSTDKNLIVCNTCVGQTTNFVMSANDTYGPIVTTSGPLSTTGADAHPWANFSR